MNGYVSDHASHAPLLDELRTGFVQGNDLEQSAGYLKLDKFTINLDLICRFSFRNFAG